VELTLGKALSCWRSPPADHLVSASMAGWIALPGAPPTAPPSPHSPNFFEVTRRLELKSRRPIQYN